MRKPQSGAIAIMLGLALSLTACNDSTTTTGDESTDCAITSMTLGSLLRRVTTATSSGKDTTYSTTVSGNAYPMYIDQLKQEIYNPDSLPLGTRVTKVAFTSISSDGMIAYRTASGNDTLYSKSDSLDFTKPRIFVCYAYSGTAKKEYTVHVNVHQVDPEKFMWGQVDSANVALSDVTAQKSFIIGDNIYIFAVKGGKPVLLTSTTANGKAWATTDLPLSGLDPSSVQYFNNQFFALDGTTLMTSADGASWTSAGSDISPEALPAVGSNRLFAIMNGAIYASSNGQTWSKDSLESDAASLPTGHFTSAWTEMNFNSNFEYILMAGTTSQGNVEWKKTLDKTGSNDEPWSLYNTNADDSYVYPAKGESQMIGYDGKTLALTTEGDTLSLFYLTSDAGRTWKQQRSSYLHPSGIYATSFSCAVDKDKYIWIFCGGSGAIWRGRINRLAFADNQKAFTE